MSERRVLVFPSALISGSQRYDGEMFILASIWAARMSSV